MLDEGDVCEISHVLFVPLFGGGVEIHMTYRIVLIEDDPQICEILTDYLTVQTDNAFVVDCANDGEKGF